MTPPNVRINKPANGHNLESTLQLAMRTLRERSVPVDAGAVFLNADGTESHAALVVREAFVERATEILTELGIEVESQVWDPA